MKSSMRRGRRCLCARATPSWTCAMIASADSCGARSSCVFNWSCGWFSTKNMGFIALPTSWKSAPTRVNRASAPMDSAACSARFATCKLCWYVPGALRRKNCRSGKSGREISINCRAVVRPSACARKYWSSSAILHAANPLKMAAPGNCSNATASMGTNGNRNANSARTPASAVAMPARKNVQTRRALPSTSTPVIEDKR